MKIKSLFLTGLAALAFASCSNDENVPVNDGSKANLSFKLSYDDPSSRAIQDPGTNVDIVISSLTLTMLNASDATVDTRVLTSDEITAAKSAAGLVIEGVDKNATKLQVTANGSTTATAISAYNKTMAFESVPLFGEDAITNTPGVTHTDGHPLYTAAVTIKPVVARFEVSGAIRVVEATNGVYAVDVEQVYINNFKGTKGSDDLTTHTMSQDWSAIYTGATNEGSLTDAISTTANPVSGSYYDTDHNLGVVANKAAAYHLFAASVATDATKTVVEQGLPHVILKVKVYQTAADFAASKPMVGYDYITIRSFTKADTKLLTSVDAGKIYKINLNDLTVNFKPNPIDPTNPVVPVDPNPEMEKFDLNVKVTVTNWTLESVTPNI